MNIGNNFKSARLLEGLTQTELSNITGVKAGQISKIENDSTTDMKVSTLMKLSKALKVTPNTLLLNHSDMDKDTFLKTTIESCRSMSDEDKAIITKILINFRKASGIDYLIKIEDEIEEEKKKNIA